MSRIFKTVDYQATLDVTVRLGDLLPPDHLARFVVDTVAQLDLSAIYARYGSRGGEPYAPEILLGLLFYGYATGTFSSRKIERGTYESAPFRFIAGNLHPDHDTLATCRKTFLRELKGLFVQILLMARLAGVLQLGRISLDGTKIHADASKSKAVSYQRLLEIERQVQAEVEELFALAERAEAEDLPEGLVISDEIARREERLARLAAAKAVLEARAKEREAQEQAAYEARVREREAKASQSGRKPRGRAPQPPIPGPRDQDQYNFTDPESRIMKNSTNQGFDQDYNAQVAVDQDSFLIVGKSLSNHPTDQAEAQPTLESIPPEVGKPAAAALDNGYFSAPNIELFQSRGIEPYIATGRAPHQQSWQERFADQPAPPPADARPQERMAYQLKTEIGKAIYAARKYTVEPVIGIIKEVLGFRQFSLRGEQAAAGEWCLVCLAFNLKRLHRLTCHHA
ncbi:MAG TPA: transposase [Candidatus Limnocylindria bacterium]|jgi:transposase|nr:transposase [Candidatus Limnocylindria bacterium]HEX3275806.1 transposase [Gemmatimonadales bacterium]